MSVNDAVAENKPYILFWIEDQGGHKVQLKQKITSPFEGSFRKFADRLGVTTYAFRYLRSNGSRVYGQDTPGSIRLRENETIEVYREQNGGSPLASC